MESVSQTVNTYSVELAAIALLALAASIYAALRRMKP